MSLPPLTPQYPRTKEGYIEFPNDIPERRRLFGDHVFAHPAKANVWMIKGLVELLTKPGETIMDIMSGTGTIMLAAGMDRRVVLIEDTHIFHAFQQYSLEHMLEQGHLTEQQAEDVLLIQGSCQDFLPLPCDHIIFSPPYSNVMKFEVRNESTAALSGSTYVKNKEVTVFRDYLGSEKNLGRKNPFYYNKEMARIYKLCYESIRPGGTITVIVQDIMQGGDRVTLSDTAMRACVHAGFRLEEWFYRYSPGTGMKKSMRAKGHKTVDNEDVIVLRRPEDD